FSSTVHCSSPQSVEDFLYTTVKIKCFSQSGESTGTGFIFDFENQRGAKYPYLVTNKHVIKDAITSELKFHLTQDNKHPIEGEHYPIRLGNDSYPFCKQFYFHPSENVDLCAYPLAIIFSRIEQNINLPPNHS